MLGLVVHLGGHYVAVRRFPAPATYERSDGRGLAEMLEEHAMVLDSHPSPSATLFTASELAQFLEDHGRRAYRVEEGPESAADARAEAHAADGKSFDKPGWWDRRLKVCSDGVRRMMDVYVYTADVDLGAPRASGPKCTAGAEADGAGGPPNAPQLGARRSRSVARLGGAAGKRARGTPPLQDVAVLSLSEPSAPTVPSSLEADATQRTGKMSQLRLYALGYTWTTSECTEHHAELKRLWKGALQVEAFSLELGRVADWHPTQTECLVINAAPGTSWRGKLRGHLGAAAPSWL